MDEKERVDLEVRLLAIEHVVAHTLSLVYRLVGVSPEMARRAGAEGYERTIAEPIPGAKDPFLADHVSAEIANAVDALMQSAARMKAEWDSSGGSLRR